MMGHKEKTSQDEHDAFSKWRHMYISFHKAGTIKKIKQAFNRKWRRKAKQELNERP